MSTTSKLEASDFSPPNSTRANPLHEKLLSQARGLVSPIFNPVRYVLGDPTPWETGDTSWNDMIGPRRRQEAIITEQKHRRQPVTSNEWWINEKVDKEAFEVGCIIVDTVSPVGPWMRHREAVATLVGLTAIIDSYCNSAERADELRNKRFLGKSIRGRTVSEWIDSACEGVDAWTREEVEHVLAMQAEAVAQQHKDAGTAQAAAQVAKNAQSYREYIRWRDLEGCYYGCLVMLAMSTGLDVRMIPGHRVAEAVEATIVGFDVHGSYRHSQEDETGDILRYMGGTHGENVTACLELVTALIQRLVEAEDLSDRDKELLLRFVCMGSLLSYTAKRWSRTTTLHIAPERREKGEWSHVDSGKNNAVTYSDVQSGGSARAEVKPASGSAEQRETDAPAAEKSDAGARERRPAQRDAPPSRPPQVPGFSMEGLGLSAERWIPVLRKTWEDRPATADAALAVTDGQGVSGGRAPTANAPDAHGSVKPASGLGLVSGGLGGSAAKLVSDLRERMNLGAPSSRHD